MEVKMRYYTRPPKSIDDIVLGSNQVTCSLAGVPTLHFNVSQDVRETCHIVAVGILFDDIVIDLKEVDRSIDSLDTITTEMKIALLNEDFRFNERYKEFPNPYPQLQKIQRLIEENTGKP